MSEPIKAGDRCEVIDGLQGRNSPNLGLIVKVVSLAGEHSKFGRIWTCHAEYGIQGQESTRQLPPGHLDFAQSWLRKLPPDAAPPEAVKTEREVSDHL